LLAVSGCEFEDADYSGTHFSCLEPPHTCPTGYTCENGDCIPGSVQADGGLIADAAMASPDAGSSAPADARPPSGHDASPPTPPDADIPDAGPPVTMTFGEGAADVQDVTTDTWLSQENPYWTYGDSHRICMDTSPNEVGLIRFDLIAIPTNAEIIAVELDVVVREILEGGDAVAFALSESWDEDTATWNERSEDVSWTDPGAGPASQTPGVVAIFTPSDLGDYTVSLDVATVQNWVADPQRNHGLAWFSTSANGHGVQFYSSDETLSSLRPMLRVTYR
jgi:hypothetical protein